MQLIEIDERWGERKYWAVLEQSSGYLTPYFLLQSIDLNLDENSGVVASDDTLYIIFWLGPFWISIVVTFFCLVLGYPLAFLLATVGKRYGPGADAAFVVAVVDFDSGAHYRLVGTPTG